MAAALPYFLSCTVNRSHKQYCDPSVCLFVCPTSHACSSKLCVLGPPDMNLQCWKSNPLLSVAVRPLKVAETDGDISFIANSHTYYYLVFHHPLTLVILCLNPSFSANPSHCSTYFLLLKYSLRGFPGLFTVISEHICFLLFSFFSCFYTF